MATTSSAKRRKSSRGTDERLERSLRRVVACEECYKIAFDLREAKGKHFVSVRGSSFGAEAPT